MNKNKIQLKQKYCKKKIIKQKKNSSILKFIKKNYKNFSTKKKFNRKKNNKINLT